MEKTVQADTWERIAAARAAGRPLCMYGMGNGADKILAVLADRGIGVDEFFASDGFVRGHSFHGRPVRSYRELCVQYPDFTVILAFGSALPEVLDNILRIARERELIAPDVPVAGEELFDGAFCARHEAELAQTEQLLADRRSREVLRAVTDFRLRGDVTALTGPDAGLEDVWDGLLHPESYRAAADLGAYNGDTAAALLARAPALRRLYVLEPDPRSYRKLCARTAALEAEEILLPFCAAAGARDGQATFSAQGNRNSAVKTTGEAQVAVRALDSLAHEPLDAIKLDVEGAEAEALTGAAEQIRRNRPDLVVSVYHRSRDLFALPLLVHRLCPDYRLYLRRARYIPAWDTVLVATAR